MLKVATLSYQHAFNYGAVFQVAALQHVITQLGADCDIIDYRCPAIDRQYDFKPIRMNSSIFSSLRANLVLAPFIIGKKKNFAHWMDSYKKTEIITDKEQLKKLNERYDKFIVGSDQVWNLKCQGHDDAFFLDFVSDSTKRIAYAASFGTYDIKPIDRGFYEKYMKNFEHISVRENRGIDLVKELSGKKSISCMDPVLLAGREFWDSKSDKSFHPSEKYIFVYQLGHGSAVPKFVKQLKKDTRLKVYFVTCHIGNMVYYSVSDKNVSTVSPELFLSLISEAEYVVTNSFHAAVLSIIYQKQFYVVSMGGEKSKYNSRIYNLLDEYKMMEVMVETYSNINGVKWNYENLESYVNQNRKQSLDYLKKTLF